MLWLHMYTMYAHVCSKCHFCLSQKFWLWNGPQWLCASSHIGNVLHFSEQNVSLYHHAHSWPLAFFRTPLWLPFTIKLARELCPTPFLLPGCISWSRINLISKTFIYGESGYCPRMERWLFYEYLCREKVFVTKYIKQVKWFYRVDELDVDTISILEFIQRGGEAKRLITWAYFYGMVHRAVRIPYRQGRLERGLFLLWNVIPKEFDRSRYAFREAILKEKVQK